MASFKAALCAGFALSLMTACSTDSGGGGTASAGTSATGAGTSSSGDGTTGSGTTTGGTGTQSGGGGSGLGIPSLVNVDLRNVLNDLSVRLNLDRANIPVNAQIPVTIAANVCGVSVNVLSVSTGGQAVCTAKTASPELAQVVQQQIAAGGSVGGGAQGGSSASTGSSAGTSGSGTAGATGTGGTSTGASEGTPAPQPTPSPTPQA